ncbi:MAG: adenylate kinase family protein [Janthinobacterium lividum]
MPASETLQGSAPAAGFLPGPLLLLGAPGVGKGTQAQILMAEWGIPQISTGDLIRDNIRRETPIGSRFQKMVAAGTLVPDEIVNEMVEDRLAQPDTQRGYILDGYPRTLGQAEWLDQWLQSNPKRQASGEGLGEAGVHPGSQLRILPLIAVLIEVRYDELLRRITGRRTGPVSKKIYNIYTNPPVSPGRCDVDGELLVQRPDDSEEVFAERMKAFHELTSPVIKHYSDLGRFEVVDGEQPVEVVTERIVAALQRLRHGASGEVHGNRD